MIKHISLFVFLFISLPAIAQVEDNYNYSIGLRVYSSMQMPKLINQTYAQNHTDTYLNGIMVKFDDNQISYRLNGYYNKKDIKFFNQCENCQEAVGNRTDYSFKAGFEKRLNYSLIQPYFGFDIGYRLDNFTGVVTNIQPGNTNTPYNIETIKTGVVMSPLIGIKFNFLKQLSMFIEGNLDFYYSYERREVVDQAIGSPTNFNRFTRLEYLLNPISTGLQFRFGSKN